MKNIKKIILSATAGILTALMLTFTGCDFTKKTDSTKAYQQSAPDEISSEYAESSTENEPETSLLDESKTYFADIEIQDEGTITIKLEQKTAPVTAANFVSLANSGFYDGLTFHRIMNGFMMQGGDPNKNGTGGFDKTIIGEFNRNGYENNISHIRGTVSMARSSLSMDSASSQFFIVQKDSTYLDGQYAAFGTVTDGMDIVDKICTEAEPIDNNGLIAEEKQPVITSIKIRTLD